MLQIRGSFSPTVNANQLQSKQQPVKNTTVRLDRVQDTTSQLGLSMPGLSALLAGKVFEFLTLLTNDNDLNAF